MATDFNLLRSRLEKEREGLIKDLERMENSSCLAGDRSGSWFGNRDEQANEASELKKQLSLKVHLRDLLAEIEHALHEIDAGTYGLCENCKQPIELARLEALPQATLCLNCKTLKERQNHGSRGI